MKKFVIDWGLWTVGFGLFLGGFQYLATTADLQVCSTDTREVDGICYCPNGTRTNRVVLKHDAAEQVYYDAEHARLQTLNSWMYLLVVMLGFVAIGIDRLIRRAKVQLERDARDRLAKEIV